METDINALVILIEKLKHPIKEVRCRALKNIYSKVQRSLVSIDDLVSCPDALTNLLEWFNQDHVLEVDIAMDLLLKISKEEYGGQNLVRIGGVEFLQALRHHLTTEKNRQMAHQIIDNLYQLTSSDTQPDSSRCVYQPSQLADSGLTDGDISARTAYSDAAAKRRDQLGRLRGTDLPTIGYFDHSESAVTTLHVTHPGPQGQVNSVEDNSTAYDPRSNFQFGVFPTLPMTVTDRQVIGTTLVSLKNPDLSVCLGAIEFLRDVIFLDFPTELFLQRRGIIKLLETILVSGDMSLVEPVCQCLTVLCNKLGERIRFHLDPNNHSSKDVFQIITGGESGPSYVQRTRELVELEYDDAVAAEGAGQLSVLHFCVGTLDNVLSQFIGLQSPDLYPVLFALLHAAVDLLIAYVNTDGQMLEWMRRRGGVEGMPEMLDKWARMMKRYGQRDEKTPPESNLPRQIYIGLCLGLFKLVKHIVTPESVLRLLPNQVREELVLVSLDEALMSSFPSVMEGLCSFLSVMDQTAALVYSAVQHLGQSMEAAANFLVAKDEALANAELCLESAEKAIDCLCVVGSVQFTREYVRFYSRLCSIEMFADTPNPGRGRQVLLQLYAYGMDVIKKAAYSETFDILKESLTTSDASNPVSISYRKALFLFDKEVLQEIVGFGLSSDNAEVKDLSGLILLQLWESRPLLSVREVVMLTSSLASIGSLLQRMATRETRLGRAILSISVTHVNPSSPTCLAVFRSPLNQIRAPLRLLFLPDPEARGDAIDRVSDVINDESQAERKQPYFADMNLRHLMDILLIETTKALDKPVTTPPSLQVESLRKVSDILMSSKVDPQVRKSAGEQVAIFLQNTELHGHFLSNKGLEFTRDLIHQGVYRESVSLTPLLVPCVTILRRLAHQNPEVRDHLISDTQIFYDLTRVVLFLNYDASARYEVSHLLTLLLFADCATSAENVPFALPATIVSGYHLPFHCPSYGAVSPHLPAPIEGINHIRTNEPAQRALRIRWTIACHGGLDQLVQEIDTYPDVYDDFTERMRLSDLDRYMLRHTLPQLGVRLALTRIDNATCHSEVSRGVESLTVALSSQAGPELIQGLDDEHWLMRLDRFFRVMPCGSADVRLLDRLLALIDAYTKLRQSSGIPASTRACLLEALKPGSPIIYCLEKGISCIGETDSVNLVNAKRTVARHIVPFFHVVVQHWIGGTHGSKDQIVNVMGLIKIIVDRMLAYMEEGIHTPFDNLNAMHFVLEILVNITARVDWQVKNFETSVTLLVSCLEYMRVFQQGRKEGGVSFMGQGILRGLLHVLNNLASANARAGKLDTLDGVWMEKAWILPYWSYRDVEIRALSLSIAGRLCSSEMLAARICLQLRRLLPEGLWAAAITLLADSKEACLVRAHAGFLLANLLSRPCPLGDTAEVALMPSNPALPVMEGDNGVRFEGLDAIRELIRQSDLFHVFGVILSNYYPYPALRGCPKASSLQTSSGKEVSVEENEYDPSTSVAAVEAMLRQSSISESGSSLSRSSWAVVVGSSTPLSSPLLVCSVCAVVQNMLHHLPEDTSQHLSTLRLNTLLMNILEPGLLNAYMKLGSGRHRALTGQVSRAYEGCVRVVREQAALSSQTRTALIEDERFITCLVRTVELDGPATLLGPLWREVFLLLLTLLHPDPGLHASLRIITPMAARATNLIESCIKILDLGVTRQKNGTKSPADRTVQRAALNTLAILLCRCSPVVRPPSAPSDSTDTPVSSTDAQPPNPLVRMLDLGYSENPDVLKDKHTVCLGERLCLALMAVKEESACNVSLTRSIQEDIRADRMALHNVFKILLAVSASAKNAAVKNGLVETQIMLIKFLHTKLEFGMSSASSSSSTSRQSPAPFPWGLYSHELCLAIDLLHNLFHASSLARSAAVNSGFVQVVHQIWPMSLQDSRLLQALLRCLVNFTAATPRACLHLTSPHCPGPTSGAGDTAAPGSASQFLPGLIRLIASTTSGPTVTDITEKQGLCKIVFTLLSNLVFSSEARKAIWKTRFLMHFSQVHPRVLSKSKAGQILQLLWLKLILNLSFSEEGQGMLIQISDVLDILTIQIEICPGKIRNTALLIVRNLCTNAALKSKLLAAEVKLIPCLSQFLQISNTRPCELVLSALKALMYENPKACVFLKTQGFLQRAMELWERCQMDPDNSLMMDIHLVLSALQE